VQQELTLLPVDLPFAALVRWGHPLLLERLHVQAAQWEPTLHPAVLPVAIHVQRELTLPPSDLLVVAPVQWGHILPLRALVAVMLAAVAHTRTLLLVRQCPHRQQTVAHVLRVITVRLQ